FVFIGGAAGKFVVGWLGDKFSTVSLIWATKGLTAVLIVAALYVPMSAMIPLLVLLGVGLNGTSSILYATVAEYVPAFRRARFYGFFYTTNEIGTVAAPIGYGVLADAYSLSATMLIMGAATALILPVSLLLLTHRFSR
ncbi:MAG: MFS transporter, partial [Chloroflexi bacterium]|nr:MFS transporter [Chloroflexota bacterium]